MSRLNAGPMAIFVHITKPPEGEFLPTLRARLAELGAEVSLTSGEQAPNPRTQVLVSGRPSEDELRALSEIRHLIVPYAGVPSATVKLVAAHGGLTLHNLHHNALPTAEHAVALLLAAARRIVPADAALRRGDWTMRYQDERGMLLHGRRALVLGHGAIGGAVARMLRGLGMEVSAVARRGNDPAVEDRWGGVHAPTDLRRLLPRADVLVICVPATPATKGMIGSPEIDLMPRHGIVVNIARGTVTDERALFEALRDGRLGAAGLDVWWNYPGDEADRAETRPSQFPYEQLENVVLSPHRAGHCDRTEWLRGRCLADLLAELANGNVDGANANRVDLGLGY